MSLSSGSVSFNGAVSPGQYLSVPSSTIGLSGQSFTIEGWFYPTDYGKTGYSAAGAAFIFSSTNTSLSSGGNFGFQFFFDGVAATSLTGLGLYYNAGNFSTFSFAFQLNTWYHIALTKNVSTNTFTIFVNGNSIGSVVNSSTWTDNSPYTIGRSNQSGYERPFTGYISNFRIVRGTVVYTGNFTPPASILPAIENTSLLLNTTDSTNFIKDNGPNRFTVTNVGSATFNTSSPFNQNSSKTRTTIDTVFSNEFDEVSLAAGSISFNGTNQYLTVPWSTAFVLTGDFTVESWMWIDSTVVSSRPDNLKYVSVFSGSGNVSGTMAFEVQGSASSAGTGLSVYQDSPSVNLSASVSIPLNSWVHIAFVRTGTTIYGFVNGQRITLGTSSATLISASGSVAIGRNQITIYYSYMKGYISNHRVVNGTAVYTANFTPPTGILPAVENTSLLLNVTDSANFIKDNGSNKFTVTNNNSATFNANGPFNQGTTGLVQRQANDGTYMVSGYFNETGILSYNPNLWFSPAITFAGVADTTVASSLPNLGVSGSIYNASTSTGAPQVATQNGVKVLNFNGSTLANLQLATEIDLSTNSSVFFVGYQTANRMVALGGSNAAGNGNAFFGWSGSDNTVFLFRNSSDGGQTLTGLQSVAGLKVFGMIQGTSTFTYYDNSTTPTNGTYVSGTYKFGKVGARDYGGSFNSQLSTGYLGDIVAFNRAVSNDEAVMIIALLKEKYNIS
jgi:hypothetical protein